MDKVINDMTYVVGKTAVTQDLSLIDSIATLHADETYCGTKTYILSPTQSFLSISGPTMSVISSNVADVGIYNVYVTVKMDNYPEVRERIKSFKVNLQHQCFFTVLTPLSLNPMKVLVGNFTDTQSFMQVTDSVAI